MTVYVDNARIPFGRMLMCHLLADTSDELYSMVDTIGVQRKWVQYPGTAREHFDISVGKRDLALRAGAASITLMQAGYMEGRRIRTGELGEPETAETWMRAIYNDPLASRLVTIMSSTRKNGLASTFEGIPCIALAAAKEIVEPIFFNELISLANPIYKRSSRLRLDAERIREVCIVFNTPKRPDVSLLSDFSQSLIPDREFVMQPVTDPTSIQFTIGTTLYRGTVDSILYQDCKPKMLDVTGIPVLSYGDPNV